jgi:hypothetical protein
MSTSAAAAGVFPNWVLLKQFVFRKDDDESFPDETKAAAVVTAAGTTTWGAEFRIAFDLADPPRISRLYAHLPVPGFLDPITPTWGLPFASWRRTTISP